MTGDPQDEVERLLEDIRVCLIEVEPLRQFVARLEKEMDALAREFQRAAGHVQEEQAHLRQEIKELDLRLQDAPPLPVNPIQPPPPDNPDMGGVPPPAPVVTDTTPLQPRAIPWAAEKRALADHLSSIIAVGQEEEIARINAIVADQRYGLGDMLELLSWGTKGSLWRERPNGESVERQVQRLQLWHGELAKRRGYWETRRGDLLKKREYATWQARQGLTDDAWAAWLVAEVQKLEQENTHLREERDALSKRWREKQAGR